MTPERWQQIDHLFHKALACEAGLRESFLAAACENDEALRLEIEALISSHQDAEHFIETPAGDIAAEYLGSRQSTFEPGQEIENYRIVKLLGTGGMGEVYLADDIRLNRRVALKLLPPHYTSNSERVRRFEREARAASALNHPNIVTIYEIGRSSSVNFIATEFVDGKTLRQLIDEKPFTLSETLNVGIQIAGALFGAHAAGIVHRDIKPENIMIRADGYVKILDFGLAKLTERQSAQSAESPTLLQSSPGMVMGTVQYMSPEQARGKKVDARSDIWSLGILLYELLAGRVPFNGETSSHVMVSLMEDELPPLRSFANVPAELELIVRKALRKNGRERQVNANQLADDLKRLKRKLQLDERGNGLLNEIPSKAIPAVRAGTATALPARELVTAKATFETRPRGGFLLPQISQGRFAGALTAVALILMFATAVYIYKYKWTGSAGVRSEVIGPLAVLPFRSSTTNTDEITGNIITGLSQLPGLQVTSLKDVLRYRDNPSVPVEVSRELNVRVLLIGTLTINGDEALISTELLDVKENKHLDDRYYRDEVKNIPWMRTRIVKDVAEALRRTGDGPPSDPNKPGGLLIQAELVPIPGGTFQMGRNDSNAFFEKPAHKVTVRDFEMDKTEVTNAEYAQFVQQTNHVPPQHWGSVKPPSGGELLPVMDVSYDDAVAFAEWRSKKDGATYRLPTEEEWEYAARNGDQNNLYPWGDTLLADRAVTNEVAAGREKRVGTFPSGANRWGVLDLIGNVWEWTSSEASLYEGNSIKLPSQWWEQRVVRGGGYNSPATRVSGATRQFVASSRSPTIGFRLVKVVSNP
jgi:serine/threonine protein kinase/formylglycine-generating enzyme required for sulfatase activity